MVAAITAASTPVTFNFQNQNASFATFCNALKAHYGPREHLKSYEEIAINVLHKDGSFNMKISGDSPSLVPRQPSIVTLCPKQQAMIELEVQKLAPETQVTEIYIPPQGKDSLPNLIPNSEIKTANLPLANASKHNRTETKSPISSERRKIRSFSTATQSVLRGIQSRSTSHILILLFVVAALVGVVSYVMLAPS
jgi:hypothetical protein